MPPAGDLRLRLTRDSVAAGDDCDARHLEEVRLPEGATVAEAIAWIAASRYLLRVGGGEATWSLISKRPIAILAQQWQRAKMLSPTPVSLASLEYAEGRLRILATYHA